MNSSDILSLDTVAFMVDGSYTLELTGKGGDFELGTGNCHIA
jgi:hypothetical protein